MVERDPCLVFLVEVVIMDRYLKSFYLLLLLASATFMVGTFVIVVLGIVSRLIEVNISGLDAYAGYSIAAALFLALPSALQQGDHIRVTLLLDRFSPRVKGIFEWWCLILAGILAIYIAWFSIRFVMMSYTLGDVSMSADATPLWIPQLAMALGCVGFAISFFHAMVLRIKGQEFIQTSNEAAHTE